MTTNISHIVKYQTVLFELLNVSETCLFTLQMVLDKWNTLLKPFKPNTLSVLRDRSIYFGVYVVWPSTLISPHNSGRKLSLEG